MESSTKGQIETESTNPSTSISNDVSFKSRTSSTASTNSSQTITVLKQEQQQEQKTNEQKNIDTKPVIRQPYNTIFKESELQVKIADLGNACWNVIYLHIFF
jgi:hypothetical protein